jgi:hypothetical protein
MQIELVQIDREIQYMINRCEFDLLPDLIDYSGNNMIQLFIRILFKSFIYFLESPETSYE